MTIEPELPPQADATGLVDAAELEAEVRDMYGQVARGEHDALHFELGRPLAERLGYPPALLDLGSGTGTDVFCAAVQVGPEVRVAGVDFTRAQIAAAAAARDAARLAQVTFVEAPIHALPFADASFDVVMSNGVINLAVDKLRVFREAARVLRPGGRLALADIVSGKPLKERTRRNVELWAACIAGAIPERNYVEAIAAAGLTLGRVRANDYEFASDRALEACSTYGVRSVSLVATKPADHGVLPGTAIPDS